MRTRDVLAFTVGWLLASIVDALDARYRAGQAECRALMDRMRAKERV
jgi:hypothetical protein